MRVVLLYEIVLKNQRLILIAGDDVVDVVDLRNQGGCFGVPSRKEVGLDTPSQVLCLSDVDNSVGCILHHVNPGVLRKGMGLVFCTHKNYNTTLKGKHP